MEGFHDESGIFGIAGHRAAAHLTYLGLHALQHRGGDSAGIVATDGDLLRSWHGVGRVQEAFGGPHLQALVGAAAIGQVVRGERPGEPLVARYRDGQLALALAGRFTNGGELRGELKERGALFASSSDAEVLLHLLAASRQRTLVNRLVDALMQVEGAFSLLLATEDRLIAVRDPHGFRPLVRGAHEGAEVFASDDAPLRFLGAEITGEVEPGEILVVDKAMMGGGATSLRPFPERARAACVQEIVQLAGGDAQVFGQAVYPLRVALGERLGREQPCPRGQVVVGLPAGGTAAALGYGRAAEIPVKEGLLEAPTGGRQYVEPPREIPDFGARLRWRPVPAVVAGQSVVLVVAAIATGEGVRRAVRLLRRAGATEVHIRSVSPLPGGACPYGVATPTEDELLHNRHGGDAEIGRALGADSIAFLTLEGLHAIVGRRADGERQWCDGCLSGRYPVRPPEDERVQLPLFEAEE